MDTGPLWTRRTTDLHGTCGQTDRDQVRKKRRVAQRTPPVVVEIPNKGQHFRNFGPTGGRCF